MPDRRKRGRGVWSFGAGLLALSFIVAAQTAPKPPDQKHDVTVRLVLVDVIAFDRDGRFVTDLATSDFEVFEDGKRMDLASAELIRLDRGRTEAAPADVAPEAAPGPFRASPFVVVFDSINTIKRMLDRSRPEILAKLNALLEVGRDIVVFELAEDGRMLLLQPLTRDRALIARAVDKATGSIWVEKAADALIVPSIMDGGRRSGSMASEPWAISSPARWRTKPRRGGASRRPSTGSSGS